MDNFFRLDDDGVYRCTAFGQFDWLTHGFGTRRSAPKVDVTLRQIHSSVVWNADGLKDREQEGDGLVSRRDNWHVGVRTADCVPILLLDVNGRTVSAVHAGWRGTAGEIVTAAISKMGAHPANIWAAIGPCIRECCYEVGPDVAERFTRWTRSPIKSNGKQNLNLAAANIRQLTQAGVPQAQVFDSHLCTYCDIETFYSFRRQPDEPGRLISAIGLA